MTDLATDPDLGDRVRGVDLLLHELWLTNEEAERDPEKLAIHSHLAGVAEFARAAGVRRLMPIHHHPSRSPRDLRRLCAQLQAASGIEVVVPEEGPCLHAGWVRGRSSSWCIDTAPPPPIMVGT